MGSEEIIALLRARSAELKEQADLKTSSLAGVSEANETREQRRVRDSAQCDWNASEELSALIEQIERTLRFSPLAGGILAMQVRRG
jgi:hypothetical protein